MTVWNSILLAAGAAEPGVVDRSETESADELARPWNVIVHNDPINLMSYVTLVFQRVFGYSRARAQRLMLEVHHQGRSLVWCGGREHAEMYVHQLHGYQLWATLEPAEQ